MKENAARKLAPEQTLTPTHPAPKAAVKPKPKTPWRTQRFKLGGEPRQKSWLDLVR